MVTVGDYISRKGEEFLIGKIFLSGGNAPYYFRFKRFYDDEEGKRCGAIDLDVRGRFQHFGGVVLEDCLDAEDVSYSYTPSLPQ